MSKRFSRFAAFSLAALATGVVPAWSSETQTYVYDELGRLVVASSTGTVNSNLKQSICYDAAGNRTQYKSDSAGAGLVCPGAPPPSLAVVNATVTEGGDLAFTVTRSGDSTMAVGASYATAGNTATSGSDFTAASGTVSFAATQTSATIYIATIDDTAVESAEAMTITLSIPTGGAAISNASATGTINDNDTAPANLVIGNATATEGGTLVFSVTRSGTTNSAVSAGYAATAGTATSGSDFTATSGIVSFAANQTSATINVATIDDAIVESAENMTVALSNPSSGAAITTGAGTGTINDNDSAAPTYLAISDAAAIEGFSLTFTVTRTGNTAISTSVNYATAIGTAGSNDFVAVSGTLTFAAGETSKTITAVANGDIRVETDEVFYVNLSGATSGATITDSQGVGTIYDNGEDGGGGGCPLC